MPKLGGDPLHPVVPVHGVLLVAFPSAGRKSDTLAILVKVVNLPALGEPFANFVHCPHGKKDVSVGQQHDFGVDDFALIGIVFLFLVVFGKQPFPALVGGRRNG